MNITTQRDVVEHIYTLKKWKDVGGRKWFDELLRSFGARYLLKEVFVSESVLVHALCDLCEKPFSRTIEDIEMESLVAERILSMKTDRPDPVDVVGDFKQHVASCLMGEAPNIYNNYEFMLNRGASPKQEEFNDC